MLLVFAILQELLLLWGSEQVLPYSSSPQRYLVFKCLLSLSISIIAWGCWVHPKLTHNDLKSALPLTLWPLAILLVSLELNV